MFTPAEIAAAVTASRDEFANVFLRAQKEADIPLADRLKFNAVTLLADDRQAFTEAATHACNNGWDAALVDELIESDCESGVLRVGRMAALVNNANLQAIHNTAQGVNHPHAVARGLTNGSRWTGNVLIDLAPVGTGVLIAPHLFLTAWHVVAPLFRMVNGQHEPIADATGRLRIDFDAVALPRLQGQTFRPARQVRPHPNWCPMFRACHIVEQNHRLPANLQELEGKWDFAIIRLAEPVGIERNWAALDGRIPVPRAKDKIYVFQYPNGPLQRYHDHEIVAATTANQLAVPKLRFLHTVNANPGSSGGPCFDKDFELFGLHQGVWQNSANPADVVNRGVPINRICETIDAETNKLPPLEPSEAPVWSLGDTNQNAAVIGCDAFLTDLWSSALPGGNRVVNITGETGAGKTIRLLVAEMLLTEANHLKVVVDAPSAVVKTPVEFAQHLCKLAGAMLPTLTPPDQVNSTLPLWRKDILVPAIVSALQTARRDRLTWLLFKDLNRCTTFGEGTSEVLYLLYQQVLTNPWLRFILDGMQGNVAEDVKRAMTFHGISAISEAEVLTYLRRRIVELQLDPETLGLPGRARGLHRDYMMHWNDPMKRAGAAKELAFRVGMTIKDDLATAGY